MSYVSVVFGSRVLFLLIVFKANLKASSSAPDGPVSIDSNIPPRKRRKKEVKFKNIFGHLSFIEQMSINKSFNQGKFAVYIELNTNKTNCKKINPLEKVENVMKCTYSVSVIRFKS